MVNSLSFFSELNQSKLNLPSSLIQSLQHVKGFDEEAFVAVHESGEQVVSIRLNPAKDYQLPTANYQLVPWSSSGHYLPGRPSFTLDPLFHAGAYYVQEASSMFLEQALKQTVNLSQPLKILDLCAAPGGKSTLIQSLMSDASLLVSNEVIKARVNVLEENIIKWGAANVIVTNNDPKDFQRLENYFDVIVIDAPCSGSGLFRKDTDAIDEWSENNVRLCSQRQQRILADVLPSLKDGGVLIYSTCSYSGAEDEDICEWIVGSPESGVGSLRLSVDEGWGIVEVQSEKHGVWGYRFFPDKVRGEGFFIAAFRKELVVGSGQLVVGGKREGKNKTKSPGVPPGETEILKSYLKSPKGFFFINQKEEVLAVPIHLNEDLAIIQSSLYIKKAGVKMGKIIRGELIPDHELALSTIIDPSVKRIDVDETTALQYLRREDIQVHTRETGWMVLTYMHMPLGWVKILPNRVNNYYPKGWRILNKR